MRRGKAACLVLAGVVAGAAAPDPLAPFVRATAPGAALPHYSDFPGDDPVGRFMDFLAAGAVADARALQPSVCFVWTRDRRRSPLSGTLRVNGVALSLDRLCAAPAPRAP